MKSISRSRADRHTVRTLFAAGVAVCAGACSGQGAPGNAEATASNAQELSTNRWGYVWSYNATSSYTANTEYQSQSNIAITHRATGRYLVAFANLSSDSGGNVQVTTYGGGSQRCKVEDWWNNGTTLETTVACYSPAGALADAEFTASFRERSGTPGVEGGYVWAFAPVNQSYNAASQRAWNSTGGPITIQRYGAGSYAVTFAGQNFLGGTAEVTAYGIDNHLCEISGWYPSGNDSVVYVGCYSATGTPADSMFSLSFSRGTPNGSLSYTYAWASDPWASDTYTPDTTYQLGTIYLNSCGTRPTPAPVTITRTSTGSYLVNFPGMPASGDPTNPFEESNVKVSAYGWSGEYCGVSYWYGDDSNATAAVQCYDVNGNPVDSYFTITYSSSTYIIC